MKFHFLTTLFLFSIPNLQDWLTWNKKLILLWKEDTTKTFKQKHFSLKDIKNNSLCDNIKWHPKRNKWFFLSYLLRNKVYICTKRFFHMIIVKISTILISSFIPMILWSWIPFHKITLTFPWMKQLSITTIIKISLPKHFQPILLKIFIEKLNNTIL